MRNKLAINLLFHPENYPGMVKIASDDIKLLLWQNDTLDEYTTWSFIKVNNRHIIRRIVWKKRTAYNLKEPETYGTEFAISKILFTQFINPFIKLNIAEMRTDEPMISIDGIECGIILNNIEVKWSDNSGLIDPELDNLYKNTIFDLKKIIPTFRY